MRDPTVVNASLAKALTLEDEPRYEFRIFEDNLLQVKEKLERVAKFIRAEETRAVYLVSIATDDCNAKIRSGLLDIKFLIKEQQRLELWKPVLKAPFPLARALVADRFFPLLALEPASLSRSQYQEGIFLREVIRRDRRIAEVVVSKERRKFAALDCRVEFGEVLIGRKKCHTVGAESTDPEPVIRITEILGIHGLANTSYVRAIKLALGIRSV